MLKIVKWPSSTLKQRSEAVDGSEVRLPSGELINIQKLADDMREVMTAAGGIGLSAIQVGIPVALVVTKFEGYEVLVNPLVQTKQVVEKKLGDEGLRAVLPLGKLVEVEEGCLSLPGFQEVVKRYNKVNVLFETPEQIAEREADQKSPPMFYANLSSFYQHIGAEAQLVEGLVAQVLQHETEHVKGEFFLDHVKPARRDAIRAALRRAR